MVVWGPAAFGVGMVRGREVGVGVVEGDDEQRAFDVGAVPGDGCGVEDVHDGVGGGSYYGGGGGGVAFEDGQVHLDGGGNEVDHFGGEMGGGGGGLAGWSRGKGGRIEG